MVCHKQPGDFVKAARTGIKNENAPMVLHRRYPLQLGSSQLA